MKYIYKYILFCILIVLTPKIFYFFGVEYLYFEKQNDIEFFVLKDVFFTAFLETFLLQCLVIKIAEILKITINKQIIISAFIFHMSHATSIINILNPMFFLAGLVLAKAYKDFQTNKQINPILGVSIIHGSANASVLIFTYLLSNFIGIKTTLKWF